MGRRLALVTSPRDGSQGAAPLTAIARQMAACGTMQDLNEVLSRALRPFAVTAYAVGYVPDAAATDADPFLLLTWPRAWLELYAREGFAREDAVVAAAAEARAPFAWCEVQARQPGASARIFAAAATFCRLKAHVLPLQADLIEVHPLRCTAV